MISGGLLLLILKLMVYVIVLRVIGIVGEYYYKKLMERENKDTQGEETLKDLK